MRNFRQHKLLLSFLGVLVFCSVMVIRQYRNNQSHHVELREAFILLHTKGYKPEARRIYERLLRDFEKLSNRQLIDDFQRTLMLVDPLATNQTNNLIYNYHWTVSSELERRSESTLQRALELAREK